MDRRKRTLLLGSGGATGITGPLTSITALSPRNYHAFQGTYLDSGSAGLSAFTNIATVGFANTDPAVFSTTLRFSSNTANSLTDASVAQSSSTYTIGFFIKFDTMTPTLNKSYAVYSSGASPDSFTVRNFVVSLRDENNDGSPLLRFVKFSSSNTRVTVSNTGLTANTMYYIEIRVTATTIKMYANGVQIQNTTHLTGQNLNSNKQSFGQIEQGSGLDTNLNLAHVYFRDGTENSTAEMNAILLEGLGIVA